MICVKYFFIANNIHLYKTKHININFGFKWILNAIYAMIILI